MGRLIIGLMSNAEQATITNVDFSEGCQITQTVQNTGDAQITIENRLAVFMDKSCTHTWIVKRILL